MKMWSMIIAHTKDYGIGFRGLLPWPTIRTDMRRFRHLTMGHIVIMGRNTFASLGDRPLPGRSNIVLTHQRLTPSQDLHICNSKEHVLREVEAIQLSSDNERQVFVIGGAEIYRTFVSYYRRVFSTVINTPYKTDVKYEPPALAHVTCSDVIEEGGVSFYFKDYSAEPTVESYPNTQEIKYLNLLSRIMAEGEERPDRTGTGTVSLFGGSLTFDLQRGFPLLTTKRVFFRGVCEELIWFLSGRCTTADRLQERGVKIWDGNSTRKYLDSVGLTTYREGELGPIYGFQWRHFGADYQGPDHDYSGEGFDQIQDVIDQIRENPSSRRILFHGWNPTQLKQMALPPCHLLYMFYVDDKMTRLNCQMIMRSTDAFLGLPFNIASTALLVHIIAHLTGKTPGKIIVTFNDVHLYQTHLGQAQTQISRYPFNFPTLEVKPFQTLSELTAENFTVVNYRSHEPIKAEMAV